MNRRLSRIAALLLISTLTLSCASYNAYKTAQTAERDKNWDVAVIEYEKALEIDPGNREYKIALDRARREASRAHFSKGKSLHAAAVNARGADQIRLTQMAITELQLTVKLDPTNQWAAVELTKAVGLANDIQRAANEQVTIDDVKKRAKANIAKAQPPQLDPTSDVPITLNFPRDTNVKDIYRALGNAFGINVLFDQAVKDDRITIELRDVTAEQAIERVMQAANHFYKVLDEKSIIIVPDNPQARRDYEDLVIRTFYLSNGDAEQVTNVVRTMIEARNVFPLKALNAITIRDTADKVRIAEKIIEANDKAKAEVVVQVELVQLDVSRIREIGFAITGGSNLGVNLTRPTTDSAGNVTGSERFLGGSLDDINSVLGTLDRVRNNLSVGLPGSATIPTASYSLLKTLGDSELLANPELRISEGEKATLHIGQRIPVPVTTVAGYNPGTSTQPGQNLVTPYTSFQYQDVGIKVGMEPRVHHNREVTLKLTVEVSNQGDKVTFAGQEQPTFATRTIESTIRLKDGETNFLAGLIQTNEINSTVKTPGLGDIPFIGRLFTKTGKEHRRTDLVLTMTPHIIRIPDITEEDVAPMWVGTGNNLTFRGVSPRIESQGSNGDPFVNNTNVNPNPRNLQLTPDGEPGNYIIPEGNATGQPMPPQQPPPGTGPTDVFRRPPVDQSPAGNGGQAKLDSNDTTTTGAGAIAASLLTTDRQTAMEAVAAEAKIAAEPDLAALRLAPRIGPQPSTMTLGPGESKVWNVIGMDLEGLVTNELVFRFDPRAMTATEVILGSALAIDPAAPPVVNVDASQGTIRVKNANGKPLTFAGGGQVLSVRVHGGLVGETFFVMENPDFHGADGKSVIAAVAGGRARVQ
jgi:general secretion pathway protein D